MSSNLGQFNSDQPWIPAVEATATESNGVYGNTTSNKDSAVYGEHKGDGIGVFGRGGAAGGEGVFGQASSAQSGVYGKNTGNGPGVVGESASSIGVLGVSGLGTGLEGRGPTAGRFEGNVQITGDVFVDGDIQMLNADCAEVFETTDPFAEPGTVMCIGEDGMLTASWLPYDHRVAGVVSGAGTCRPAIVLNSRARGERHASIALTGRVFCKVDATYGAIGLGDLLTTSPTPGHAMCARDDHKAFGAVIGKALSPHSDGKGLIPILVTLH